MTETRRWLGATLARTNFYLQRFLVERCGLIVSAFVSALLYIGYFRDLALGLAAWRPVAVAALTGMMLLWRGLLGRPPRASTVASHLDRFELGLLLLAAIFIAIQAAGKAQSWLQPLIYLCVAYLVGFSARAVGLALVAGAVFLQIASHHGSGHGGAQQALIPAAFIVAFGLANILLLQIEVARRRREHDRRLADDIRAMRREARDYRLIRTALSSAEQNRALEESKLARASVDSIHQGMYFMLELLKHALDLHTCVLLWLDSSGRRLRIKELVTDSRLVTETTIPAQAGALGGVLKNRLLLNLRSPRQASRALPYYAGPEAIGAFVGVPVIEETHLRGVLCADRKADRPFSETEERLLISATEQILHAIQNERVFAAVERSKYEHERFYRGSSMLNGALTLAQVYETAFAAAREIVEFDFGALTLYDGKSKKHTICRVIGERAERFEGKVFGNNAGLVAMVVKNKHFLPAGGSVLGDREMVVFTRRLRLPQARSLVVLPLIVQDVAIGAFVFAADASERFHKRVREMLGVISNQVAVSIENAKMYKRMEEMATTDGLTSLPNHRTFQNRFAEMLHRAERYNQPVSMVLTDVDRFKLVNDTYGHPVGDVVLKRVAKVLADQVRKVDLVARYGGEEFVMVLEDSDAAGAMLLCERVRKEIAAQVMSSDKGPFRVSISLGIASYPEDGAEKSRLIERADQALYHAKETGRNKTVHYREIRRRNVAG